MHSRIEPLFYVCLPAVDLRTDYQYLHNYCIWKILYIYNFISHKVFIYFFVFLRNISRPTVTTSAAHTFVFQRHSRSMDDSFSWLNWTSDRQKWQSSRCKIIRLRTLRSPDLPTLKPLLFLIIPILVRFPKSIVDLWVQREI